MSTTHFETVEEQTKRIKTITIPNEYVKEITYVRSSEPSSGVIDFFTIELTQYSKDMIKERQKYPSGSPDIVEYITQEYHDFPRVNSIEDGRNQISFTTIMFLEHIENDLKNL
jgi:hypothetical protein